MWVGSEMRIYWYLVLGDDHIMRSWSTGLGYGKSSWRVFPLRMMFVDNADNNHGICMECLSRFHALVSSRWCDGDSAFPKMDSSRLCALLCVHVWLFFLTKRLIVIG